MKAINNKIITLLITLCLVLTIGLSSTAAEDTVINGISEELKIVDIGIYRDVKGNLWIPLRDFSNEVGGTLYFNQNLNVVVFVLNSPPDIAVLGLSNSSDKLKVIEGRAIVAYNEIKGFSGLSVDGDILRYEKDSLEISFKITNQVKKVIGEHSIESNLNDSNNRNAIIAGKKINDFTVGVGEVFSFNNVVGPRTFNTGFLTGRSIVGDSWVDDVGGGVCRTSTLIHNAVLKSGLEVIERHPHTKPVSYAPVGKDAAVWYGLLDYKFRNNSTSPVTVKFSQSGKNLVVSLVQVVNN